MLSENGRSYYEIYGRTKITIDELKKFPGCTGKSDEELGNIADGLFDLAVLFQKTMIEDNERPK